jgi:hypothetical protein
MGGLMFGILRTIPMNARRWLGFALLFVFFPVNFPLLETLFTNFAGGAPGVLPLYGAFIAGAILLFYPTRTEMKNKLMPPEEEE